MLVLTRAIGESIRIADDVYVTVVDISGKQVRVGIEAPQTLAVHREEVFRRIAAEGAAGSDAHDAHDARPATRDSGAKAVRIVHKPRRRLPP